MPVHGMANGPEFDVNGWCRPGITWMLILLAMSAVTAARAAPPAPDPGGAPRIGLVLSGGGARGAAHVGVLKVLDELRIPVHFVSGTSMGSVVGGLYAAGMTPEELEKELVTVDWEWAFSDRPDRPTRYFRKKEDDIFSLNPIRIHFAGGAPKLPMGLIPAQRLTNLLKTYELRLDTATDFDELPIPFRSVAADLATGEPVVISRGSLATAMRASMSLPGVFPPVELEGRTLIDGGVAWNLPLQPAVDAGVDIIIAVDISTPFEYWPEAKSYLEVIRRLGDYLTRGSVTREVERSLRSQDILIKPELGDMDAMSFDLVAEAILIGEASAREAASALQAYALDEESWRQWKQHHDQGPPPTVQVRDVLIRNNSSVRDEILSSHIHIDRGQPVDRDRLIDDVAELYDLDLFEPIAVSALRDGDQMDLQFDVDGTRSGRSIMSPALSLMDDFVGGESFNFRLRYQRLAINRWAGELRVDIGVGEPSGLIAELHQPVDSDLRYFVAPRVGLTRRDYPQTVDGRTVGQIEIREGAGGLDLGRNLGHWGQLRVGIERAVVDSHVVIGEQVADPANSDVSRGKLELRVDTLDSATWPSSGALVRVAVGGSSKILGGETETSRLLASAEQAVSFHHTTLLAGIEWSQDLGHSGVDQGVFLGGPFRLSGLRARELFEDQGVLLRLRTYRNMSGGRINFIPAGWYLGLSAEAGQVFDEREDIDLGQLLLAGSLFAGLDTPIGPFLLGYGLSEGGHNRAFFSLGYGLW